MSWDLPLAPSVWHRDMHTRLDINAANTGKDSESFMTTYFFGCAQFDIFKSSSGQERLKMIDEEFLPCSPSLSIIAPDIAFL